jgi:hypothetical protein
MLVAGAGAALLGPGAANAAPVAPGTPAAPAAPMAYPAPPPKLTVSHATIKVGKKIKLKGKGYDANEYIRISVTTDIIQFDGPHAMPDSSIVTEERVKTDKHGKFEVSFKLSQAGDTTVKAKGEDSHLTATVKVEVKPKKKKKHHNAALAAPAGTDRLADTTAHDATLAGKTTLLASDSKAVETGAIRTPLGALGTLALLLGGGLLMGRSLRRRGSTE